MKLIQGSKNNIKMTTSTIFLVFPLLNLNKFYRFLQQAPKSQDPSCLKLYENVFVYFESADFMKILQEVIIQGLRKTQAFYEKIQTISKTFKLV